MTFGYSTYHSLVGAESEFGNDNRVEGKDTIVRDVEDDVDEEDDPRFRVKEGFVDLGLLESLKCEAS